MRYFISAAILLMVFSAISQTADYAATASIKNPELVQVSHNSSVISDLKTQILPESTGIIDLSSDALSQEASIVLPAVKFFPSSISGYLPTLDAAPDLLFALLGMVLFGLVVSLLLRMSRGK